MSGRRSIRLVFDHVARVTGVLRLWERAMYRRPTVLMYHRVLPDEECGDYPFPSLVMPLSMFERQMQWLARHSRVVPLATAVEAWQNGDRGSGEPRVVVSFDDGYSDNVDIAAPVLDRLGLPGTFFVTTDFVAGRGSMWYDRAAIAVRVLGMARVAAIVGEHGLTAPLPDALAVHGRAAWVEVLKPCKPAVRRSVVEALERDCNGRLDLTGFRSMTPADVRRLCDRGHEVGAHSVSHEILTTVDDDQLDSELRESRRLVAAWSGREVSGFCYPNGSLDDRVVAAARRAGYAYAVSTAPPERTDYVDLMRIPRVDVTQHRVTRPNGSFDLVAFRAEVAGLHEVLR